MTDPKLVAALGGPTAGAVDAILDRIIGIEKHLAEATVLEPLEDATPLTPAMLDSAKTSGISAVEYNRMVEKFNRQVRITNATLAGADTPFRKEDMPTVEALLARLASLERRHAELAATVYGSPDLAALAQGS